MTSERQRILRKIRACLRLSRSCNPNEAAAALRQAQRLMAAHGIDAETASAEIGSREASTRQRGTAPLQSVVALATLIAAGFRCRAVVVRCRMIVGGSTTMRFYGADSDAEVAAYAFTVLRRQLDTDKARHVRRCRKRIIKEQRAEAFALGWVAAVRQLFPTAELPPELTLAVDAAIQADAGSTTVGETTGREVGQPRTDGKDRIAGYAAGRSARYHPGVNGKAPARIGFDAGEVTP